MQNKISENFNKKSGQKEELRKIFLSKRKELSTDDLRQLNAGLFERFKAIPLHGIRFMHFFLPLKRFNEPDTLPLIHWIFKNHPEIKIVLSRANIETNLMEHFVWNDEQELVTNRWGIQEPQEGTKVLSQQLDAVVVPLLVIDKEGNRIGFGKGFYDRFLGDCREDCQKIGLSLFDPIDQINDPDSHDIKLDLCITKDQIWHF